MRWAALLVICLVLLVGISICRWRQYDASRRRTAGLATLAELFRSARIGDSGATTFEEVWVIVSTEYPESTRSPASGGELASPAAPNPFPGILPDEDYSYGRLPSWPAIVSPGQVPLLWDPQTFVGGPYVLHLNGNTELMTVDELRLAIGRFDTSHR